MSTLKKDEMEKYAMMDEKKRKRMISNKESARRSRMRKQKLLQDLTEEISRLQIANTTILDNINSATEVYMKQEAENNVLRAQEMELTERLRSLNDIIENYGLPVEIPDPLLNPWQLPYPMQPIPASSGFFCFDQ